MEGIPCVSPVFYTNKVCVDFSVHHLFEVGSHQVLGGRAWGVRVPVYGQKFCARVWGRRCPLRRRGGPWCPRQPLRLAGVQTGPAAGGGGGSPRTMPMSSTAGPAPAPCPRAGTAAGPRGSTISWGRGRTGPSTTGTLARTTPGRRPASGSSTATPWSPPRRGGRTERSPTGHPSPGTMGTREPMPG